MAVDLKKLSVQQIRDRYVHGDEPITSQLLNKLKRDPRRGVRRIYETLKRRFEKQRDERLRLDAMLNFERVLWKSGVQHIAGVDEAGVGCLAGPVVAAAVVFPPDTEFFGIDDSKRLDAEQREYFAGRIRELAAGIGIGQADAPEIDKINIYQADILAMQRAVENLPMRPDHLLVDARSLPDCAIPQNTFNKGDGIDFSIAAASIIAKTHRDQLMDDYDRRYPEYGFARHKGYATKAHQDAIRNYGPCPIHRMSYPFIRELQGEFSERFYELKDCLEAARDAPSLKAFEDRFEACMGELSENEQRKLRLLLTRRWKML